MLKSVASTLFTLSAVNAQVPVWGQCGGSGWTGPTGCVAAATCVYSNAYYSQCLPSTAPTTVHDSPTASSGPDDIPVWGQCGGQGFVGSTTCVSGAHCTYNNPWYSQCLPQTSSSTVISHSSTSKSPPPKPTHSTSSSSSKGAPTPTSKPAPKPTSSSSSAAPPTNSNPPTPASGFLGGVNLAGFDFSVFPDGSFSGTGDPPPMSQISHFSKQGVNIYRVPTAWQLVTPTLGGTLSEGWFEQYDAVIQQGLKADAKMIIDIHNYARWNGRLIGESGGPTNAQFASLWSQIATKYKAEENVIFGIMNEPHDLNSISDWAGSVQAAVNAIRSTGATSQMILIPGSSWSSAAALPTEAGPTLLKVVDSDGTKNKLIFDVHRYLDSDNSGTSTECVTDNVNVLQTLVSWLQANGNRQALLSETGGGNTASCETHLKTELAYVKANSKSIIGFTVWAAGSFQTSYTLAVTPNSDGSDMPLWTEAVKPNLP